MTYAHPVPPEEVAVMGAPDSVPVTDPHTVLPPPSVPAPRVPPGVTPPSAPPGGSPDHLSDAPAGLLPLEVQPESVPDGGTDTPERPPDSSPDARPERPDSVPAGGPVMPDASLDATHELTDAGTVLTDGPLDDAGSSLGARLRRRQIDEQSARSTADALAPGVPSQREPATVPGDIGAAIESLGEQNPAAAQLLCLCAVLHKAPVPVDVFTRSLGRLPRPLGGVAPIQFNRLVAALVESGLARRGAGGLLVPEPVRTAVRDDLGEAASAVCRSYAGVLVAAAVPDEVEASTSWPRWAALAPHLIASDAAHSTDQALRTAACRLVESLLHRGKARPARTIAAELHKGWRDVLGSDHPDTLRCAHELSRALIAAGALLPARKLLDDTVARLVTRLGSSHPQTRVAAETRRGVLIRMGGMPRPDGSRPKAAHRRRKHP